MTQVGSDAVPSRIRQRSLGLVPGPRLACSNTAQRAHTKKGAIGHQKYLASPHGQLGTVEKKSSDFGSLEMNWSFFV